MQYFIALLEGVITFISPCHLPMLPVYLSYFAGGSVEVEDERLFGRTFKNALGFVSGFTLVYLALGAFAGTLGQLLFRYQSTVNLVGGAIVVLFGLNFLGLFRLGRGGHGGGRQRQRSRPVGFFSSLVLGAVFSITWSPCTGVFLGSALLMASQQGSVLRGIIMLLFYSLGLGIPFLLSALLMQRLKSAFDFIKRHYDVINLLSGLLLIVMGVLMMTGLMGRLLLFLD